MVFLLYTVPSEALLPSDFWRSFQLREIPPPSKFWGTSLTPFTSSTFPQCSPQFSRKPSPDFPPRLYQTEISFWVLFTPFRQRLWSLESSVHKGWMNRRGGQTDTRPRRRFWRAGGRGASPGCTRACTWAPACSGSSPAACGWSWTPRWTWSALHLYTSPGPGEWGWWAVISNEW